MRLKPSGEILKKIRQSRTLYSADKKIVTGRGNPNKPEFLIFGEAPGKKENVEGIPFVGRAGNVLDYWLQEAKVSNFYISNVVPLIPLNAEKKIRRPSKEEREFFKFFVKWVIQETKPKFIIVLGDSAAFSLMDKKIKDIIGKKDKHEDIGMPLTGIYHPARYIRLGKQDTDGLNDFKKAIKLLRV